MHVEAVRMEAETELSWTEKFNLIEAELKRDPARSDALIAKTIGLVSKASVYRVREALEAEDRIEKVPYDRRVGVTGKLNVTRVNNLTAGGKRIPELLGKTVADLCREAMRLEEEGNSTKDAASLVGMSALSFRQAKAIVRLSDRDDLATEEAALVQQSLDEMNATRRTGLPHRRIAALAEKVWGRLPKDQRTSDRRVAAFQHAMTILADACTTAVDVEIPYLSDEERLAIIKQVDEAAAAVRKVKANLIKGRWE